MSNHHPIVHIEISANDHAEAGEFYASVFGWKLKAYPEMNYTTFDTGEGVGGGFNPVTEDNPAGTIMVYINADNLEDTLGKIKAAGGEIVLASFDIPTVGTMAIFKDPTGNQLALLKPLPMSEGMD
jgi:predicted enzyme related to lactoylglutathione lyase